MVIKGARFKKNPVPLPDLTQYEWHLTRAAIDQVLHYTHWIPVGRGFTRDFLAANYPGWDLASLIKVFVAAGIKMSPQSGGSPFGGRCHWRVKELHFNNEDDFFVEWDESIKRDDGRFLYTEGTGPRRTPRPYY